MSLAIFMRDAASVFRLPDAATNASWAASWANLLSALTNGRAVFSAILLATCSEKSGWVFRPVPTAVPPRANSKRSVSEFSILRISESSIETYPENSWPSVRGTASIKWVLPILTIEEKSSDLADSASLMWESAGRSL